MSLPQTRYVNIDLLYERDVIVLLPCIKKKITEIYNLMELKGHRVKST